ncbi:hypothetical protein MsAg5_16740 [Methanosarcinaceae archaeon Ag5]|uniref:DUF4177 domain-containing protein n=1 Tax=Methanolapillus africanus TaxID=3028297 RepID=A0AAE4SFX0_9EURY|nr:hypothetical protein [Methanosarcinaceae archaeon Ag5]
MSIESIQVPGFFDIKSKNHNHQNYESLLDFEYEMDAVDELNIVDQIESYAAQGWQFASICGEFIIFKRPIRFMD